ncbi:MAG TPA: sensor histidine kinase [Burkholderiales bacterium]|nr:sensor histidine kinase [Burkholderiales bacterium]
MPPSIRNHSLRSLLLAWVLIPLLFLLAIATGGAFYIARVSVTDAYDKALLDPIQALSQHIEIKNEHPVLVMSPESLRSLFTHAYDSVYYQIANEDGKIFAGDLHLPLPAYLGAKPIFYTTRYSGRKVRVGVLRVPLDNGARFDNVPHFVVIQIAETLIRRDRNLYELLAVMIAPALIIAFAAILLVWFGIGRGLTPLRDLQAEIAARSLLDLSPVPEEHAPIEVRLVIGALNNLLRGLSASIDGQQRFLANAAHQLRTPLAGLQTQLEIALRNEMPVELRGMLEQLLDATQRAAHIANQLLALARAEPGSQYLVNQQNLDLAQLIESNIAFWLHRAAIKNIDLGFEISSAPLRGDSLLIGELIANLVDNAIRYTGENGYITVRCYQDGGAVLEVEDNGIGIPQSQREKVLERFYRVDGSPGNGCGLGLAIVKEIVRQHNAELQISDPDAGMGTRMIVRFPKAN